MLLPAKRIFSLLALLAMASGAYVGKWHGFTNKERVTSLIAHQGFMYAGTQGGIRRVNPINLEEKDYDNLDGPLDCWITGLAESGDGMLWAVSHDGYVYALSGDHWETYGRSYAAQQWLMNDRAVMASGQYLFLGSEKGLTVFDLNHKVSQANITRFGDLTGTSVLSLLRRADTLYIGTSQGVYKAGIDFSNPANPAAGYGNLSDPHIWLQAPLSSTDASGNPRQYNFLAFIGDSLETSGPGTLLQTPVHVEAFLDHSVVIGGKSFGAVTQVTSALVFNGKLFLGGPGGLLLSSGPLENNPTLSALPRSSLFTPDTVVNVAALQGKFWGQSAHGLYQFNPGNGDSIFFGSIGPYFTSVPNASLIDRHLRNLKLADNGDAYVGSWGGGLIRFRNGGQRVWTHQSDACIFEILPDFPVVHAVSNVYKNHLFFSMFKSETGADHQLVHLNTNTGQITCPDSNVAGGHPHAVEMLSDSLLGAGSDQGVTFYRIREGVAAPVLTSLGLWTTDGSANETWGLAADQLGQPWALIGGQLAYLGRETLDSAYASPGSTAKKFKLPDGFAGTDCFSLEGDLSGSLWVGCGNGLFHVIPSQTGIAKINRYGLDDGLLSLSISDISVDPANGHVWIATDRGVSMLESAAQPPVSSLQTVRVYPNPFRPQHRFVIFDNLPRNSTLRLHNAAGAVVRIFRPRNLLGNQAQWDGTNEDGKPVAPGVYLYSITAGSSVERGKIIVAR
jgi:hypothetical protein